MLVATNRFLDGCELRSSTEVGIDVVRMMEAVDDSLEHDGARVNVAASRVRL